MHLTISGGKAAPQQQGFAELQWSHVLCQSPEGSVPAAAASEGIPGDRDVASPDTAPVPPTASSQTQLSPPLPTSPFALAEAPCVGAVQLLFSDLASSISPAWVGSC